MPLVAAAAIGAGGSIFSGLMGRSAAGTAAQQQALAAQKGINIAQQNLGSAVGAQNQATGQIQGFYQPYMQAGQQGLGTLSQMLSMPGQGLLQGWNQSFQAPTAAQAAATPGYQFALQQGLNAAQNSAAARGTLLSGGTLKGLTNYGEGVASTNYQQTYNNAFQNYLQNYGQFQQNQQNIYNRLMGLTGIGQGATGQLAGLTQQGAGNLAGIYGQNTAAMSSLLGAQGAAQASGTIGQANALGGMFSNIGNTAMNVGLLNYLKTGAGGGGGGGGSPFFGNLSPTQISGAFGGPTSVATDVPNIPIDTSMYQ